MPRRDDIAAHLRQLFPKAPAQDLASILERAVESRGLRKASPPNAAWLSAVAHIRHALTDYDNLLAEGYDVESARHFCLPQIDAVLADWGARRRIGDDAEALF
jgi:hypothetical protein